MNNRMVRCDYCWRELRSGFDTQDCCDLILCAKCKAEHWKMCHP